MARRYVLGIMGRMGDTPAVADLERFPSIAFAHTEFHERLSHPERSHRFDYVYREAEYSNTARYGGSAYLDIYVVNAAGIDHALSLLRNSDGEYLPTRITRHDDLISIHPDIRS